MKFSPITFYSNQLSGLESCVTARGTNCTSGSFLSGPVRWSWFDYTSSVPGTSYESAQFIIETGSTTRAVILTVGGGGAGAADDGASIGAGGGGGVGVRQGVSLETGSYGVQVGPGGAGFRGVAVSPTTNGNDGSATKFLSGSEELSSGGGEGGFSNANGGSGGKSGENFGPTFTNGNTSVANAGGAGARQGVTGSTQVPGVGFFFEYGVSDPGAGFDQDKSLSLGGGGENDNSTFNPSNTFGGGEYRTAYPPGDAPDTGQGGGGAPGVVVFDPGGAGTFFTSNGGGGRCLVLVPTNLCTSSLYTLPSGVRRQGLMQWVEPNIANSFGKNFSSNQVLDLVRPKSNLTITPNIEPTGSLHYVETFYTSSVGIIDTNYSASFIPYQALQSVVNGDEYNSDIPVNPVAQGYTQEWQGIVSGSQKVFAVSSGSNITGVDPLFASTTTAKAGVHQYLYMETLLTLGSSAVSQSDFYLIGSSSVSDEITDQYAMMYYTQGNTNGCTQFQFNFADFNATGSYVPCGCYNEQEIWINVAGQSLTQVRGVNNGTTPTISAGSVVNQGAFTPSSDDGLFELYRNGSPILSLGHVDIPTSETSLSSYVDSSITNKLIRLYNTQLSTSDLISNYSASALPI